MNKHNIIYFICIAIFLCFSNLDLKANNKDFTLIIDPGHGGKDPGALGTISKEKDITLKVAIQAGKLIEAKHKDVKILYTRTNDKYVTLQERSSFANKNNGDFFISIHINASESKGAYGAETYTIGLSKSKANFEVAKRENSVMLFEEDNEVTYQNFDPNSPDSYIMFEMSTDIYRDQSVELADYVQKELKSLKRLDRGVRQAGFLVLHQVKMPSILVELGFLSNANEEKYLTSSNGVSSLAKSIANAFDKYKHEYDKRTTSTVAVEKMYEKQEKTENSQIIQLPKKNVSETAIVFKVQTFSSKTKLPNNHDELKKIKNFQPIEHTFENGWYKYTCGNTNSFDEILETRNKIKIKFPDAFVVAFKNGKKISIKEALNQIK